MREFWEELTACLEIWGPILGFIAFLAVLKLAMIALAWVLAL